MLQPLDSYAVMGTQIHLIVNYQPHSFSEDFPATTACEAIPLICELDWL